MLVAPLSRRVLGLSAGGALVFGLAVIGTGGVAQATPSYTVSGSGTSAPVPAGICSIDWDLNGGSGGLDSGGTGGGGAGEVTVTLPASTGDTFTLYPGTAGQNAADGGAGGTNGYSDASTAGTAGDASSGGGGAASVVTKGGSLYLLAFGGNGSGAHPGSGGGTGVNRAPTDDPTFSSSQPWGQSGAGAIIGHGVPCAPTTPYLNYAFPGDGSFTLNFADGASRSWDTQPVSYEWTGDGGTTWAALTTTADDGRYTATVTGLTNGTAYTVAVRAVGGSNTVPSAASNSRTVTPFKTASAPTGIVVTTAPATMTVSWNSATAGDYAITGYEVVLPWSRGERGGADQLCETTATVHTCTGPAPAGPARDVLVYAVDSEGNQGDTGHATSPSVPFPAGPPTGTAALTTPAGTSTSLHQGSTMTVSGSGYAPFSSVTVLIYSTPQLLTTVVADASGSFTATVTVPAGLPSGNHTLVASGVDDSGVLRYVTLPVTVTQGTARVVGLAATGADVLPWLVGGLAAIVVGTALLVLGRRPRTA